MFADGKQVRVKGLIDPMRDPEAVMIINLLLVKSLRLEQLKCPVLM